MVGKHAVLMKKYDAEVLLQQVVFDRLAIWARILALPSRMMNAERGRIIAEPIGLVRKVESDALGRCWGGFMRLRVEINVNEPLMRAVTVFSSKLKTTESFAVQYERLPFFCFSCGLLGHSHLVCETPADHDESGDLPYPAKHLSVDESVKRSGGSKSGTNAASTSHSRASVNGAAMGRGKASSDNPSQNEENEISSPMKQGRGAARGRGRAKRGRGTGRGTATGKELFPPTQSKQSTGSKKRKNAKDQKQNTLLLEGPQTATDTLALTVAGTLIPVEAVDDDVLSSDSNKKQRTTPSRSADPAEAVSQPRQTQ
jgi:hypothetical protein